jgi:hypothetical protein
MRSNNELKQVLVKVLSNLSIDSKLELVNALLLDIEAEFEPKPQVPSSTKSETRKLKHPLGSPPVSMEDYEDLLFIDDFDPRTYFALTGKPRLETKTHGQDIHSLRLQDAAEVFRRLLLKNGYIDAPPSLIDLAKEAKQQDARRAFENRPRPAWAEWVCASDETEEGDPALMVLRQQADAHDEGDT